MKTSILLGTQNPSKLAEMKTYFEGLDACPVTPGEITLQHPFIPETADTVRGNAIQKAVAWHRISGLPVLAEDSGLVFTDLPDKHPDQPGQFVRRLDGRSMSDEEMLEHYIQLIRRHGGELRACWSNCWCLLADDLHGETHENHSSVFLLRDKPSSQRHSGWPLDSISWLPEAGKYLVECSEDEKEYKNMKAGYKDSFHIWFAHALDQLVHEAMPFLQ